MELRQVSQRYRRRGPWVLDGVDLAVASGEAVRVVGANGAGKTTLLRVAAGLLRPSVGEVRRSGGRVGWAPERFDGAGRLTARELLRALAVDPAEVASLAGALGLEAWLDRPLGEASKGTRRKVVLAQALGGAPAALVLDEPWSGLDGPARAAAAELVERRRADGAAVLLCEHEDGPLRCDRTLALREGALTDGVAPVRAAVEVAGDAAAVAALAAEARVRGLEVRER
ncbi:MAG TPA: ABC transporter ATP-binding protein [Capillimicrobium sp.]|jgi:ABC-type multidrug transport system ATPase subunit